MSNCTQYTGYVLVIPIWRTGKRTAYSLHRVKKMPVQVMLSCTFCQIFRVIVNTYIVGRLPARSMRIRNQISIVLSGPSTGAWRFCCDHQHRVRSTHVTHCAWYVVILRELPVSELVLGSIQVGYISCPHKSLTINSSAKCKQKS